MKKIWLNLGAALLICTTFSACQKTTTYPNNTDEDMQLGLESDSFVSDFSLNNLAGTSAMGTMATTATTPTVSKEAFAWTSGTVNIAKFKLEVTKDGVPLELQSSSLTSVDLFALTPLLSTIKIPKGIYKNIELRLVLSKVAAGGTSPLVLNGTFTTGAGTQWPVKFDFNDDLEVKAAVPDITVDGNSDLVTKLNMHLNKFLATVTAQQVDAATRANGAILISSTSNVSLYNKIKANLLTSSDSKFQATVKKK